MSTEFWAIIGTGISVLVAIAVSSHETTRRFDRMNESMNARFDRMNERLADMQADIVRLQGSFEEMRRWTTDLVNAVLRRPAA